MLKFVEFACDEDSPFAGLHRYRLLGQLLEVEGFTTIQGRRIPIEGLGKLDHNWNRW